MNESCASVCNLGHRIYHQIDIFAFGSARYEAFSDGLTFVDLSRMLHCKSPGIGRLNKIMVQFFSSLFVSIPRKPPTFPTLEPSGPPLTFAESPLK